MEGERNTTESKVQAEVVQLVNRAKATANNLVTETQQQADVQIITADSRLQATKAQYAALTEEGRAEQANLEAFDAQRRHDYEIAKAKVFEEFARNQKRIVVSGHSGDALLSQIINLNLEAPAKQAKK